MTHVGRSGLLVALLLTACGGCGPDATVAPPPAPTRTYHFRLTGPAPWNRTVHYATGDRVDSPEPYEPAILEDDGSFVVRGHHGDAYHVRAERAPTHAETRLFWDFDHRGTLGTGMLRDPAAVVPVTTPRRAVVEINAPATKAGPDVVTLYVESQRAAATAIRDELKGLDLAAFGLDDRADGNSYRTTAPPRPWRLDEFAPGPCVIAARTEGHVWTAVAADLSPGAFVSLDVGAQPLASEGGTVVCEDPFAILLLAGELGVPAPRRTTRLHFRSRWDGVPAGRHTVRYADGRTAPVEIEPGSEVLLGP